jgi:hypothetical protein
MLCGDHRQVCTVSIAQATQLSPQLYSGKLALARTVYDCAMPSPSLQNLDIGTRHVLDTCSSF